MGYEGSQKGCQVTYKELFPKVVERDRDAIQNQVGYITTGYTDFATIIETALDDAFQRGVKYGTDAVLNDPQAYDLVSSDRGGN